MHISLIVAVSENNIIGRDGGLPWRLSDDLRRFKRRTMGHTIIMGRRTWESIGRPLPGRTSIVVSRQTDWNADGALVANDLDGAITLAMTANAVRDEVFIVGGGELYRAALPRADHIYFTRIHATIDGDVTFPEVDWEAWELVEESRHEADERNDHAFTSQVWRRRAR